MSQKPGSPLASHDSLKGDGPLRSIWIFVDRLLVEDYSDQRIAPSTMIQQSMHEPALAHTSLAMEDHRRSPLHHSSCDEALELGDNIGTADEKRRTAFENIFREIHKW